MIPMTGGINLYYLLCLISISAGKTYCCTQQCTYLKFRFKGFFYGLDVK